MIRWPERLSERCSRAPLACDAVRFVSRTLLRREVCAWFVCVFVFVSTRVWGVCVCLCVCTEWCQGALSVKQFLLPGTATLAVKELLLVYWHNKLY